MAFVLKVTFSFGPLGRLAFTALSAPRVAQLAVTEPGCTSIIHRPVGKIY